MRRRYLRRRRLTRRRRRRLRRRLRLRLHNLFDLLPRGGFLLTAFHLLP